jgi:hypothetical protein
MGAIRRTCMILIRKPKEKRPAADERRKSEISYKAGCECVE